MADRVIGLDIGAAAVKAAQVLRNSDGSSVVEHQASARVPRGLMQDGHVDPSRRHIMAEIISGLIGAPGFTTKDVVVGLNSSAAVFMDKVTLPPMPESDYAEAIPVIVSAENPGYSPDDSEFSFTVTGTDEKTGEVHAIAYRASAPYVKEVAELVESAGLNVVGMDFSSLALLRAIRVPERPAGQVDAIVDIGESVTTMVLHRHGAPVSLTIDPSVSGSVATSRILDSLNLDDDSADEAESLKISDDTVYGPVAQARNDFCRMLAGRVAATFNSVIKGRREEIDAIAMITLTGGGAHLPTLGHQLRETTGGVALSRAAFDEAISSSTGRVERDDPAAGGDFFVAIGLGTGATIS